jgi:hypothetical protein
LGVAESGHVGLGSHRRSLWHELAAGAQSA